jgi:hypothetical protein
MGRMKPRGNSARFQSPPKKSERPQTGSARSPERRHFTWIFWAGDSNLSLYLTGFVILTAIFKFFQTWIDMAKKTEQAQKDLADSSKGLLDATKDYAGVAGVLGEPGDLGLGGEFAHLVTQRVHDARPRRPPGRENRPQQSDRGRHGQAHTDDARRDRQRIADRGECRRRLPPQSELEFR